MFFLQKLFRLWAFIFLFAVHSNAIFRNMPYPHATPHLDIIGPKQVNTEGNRIKYACK